MVTFRLTVKAMKGGATEFLLKPFDEDDFVRAIDAAIAAGFKLHKSLAD